MNRFYIVKSLCHPRFSLTSTGLIIRTTFSAGFSGHYKLGVDSNLFRQFVLKRVVPYFPTGCAKKSAKKITILFFSVSKKFMNKRESDMESIKQSVSFYKGYRHKPGTAGELSRT